MRIGFVYEDKQGEALKTAASHASEASAGVEFVYSPAPEALKVPVLAKRLLSNSSCEAVIAIVHADAEKHDLLSMLNNKLIDIELSQDKLIFLEAVFDDEWHTSEDLTRVAEEKIKDALRKTARVQPGQDTSTPNWMPGQPTSQSDQEGISVPEESESEALSFMQEEVGDKLF